MLLSYGIEALVEAIWGLLPVIIPLMLLAIVAVAVSGRG